MNKTIYEHGTDSSAHRKYERMLTMRKPSANTTLRENY